MVTFSEDLKKRKYNKIIKQLRYHGIFVLVKRSLSCYSYVISLICCASVHPSLGSVRPWQPYL